MENTEKLNSTQKPVAKCTYSNIFQLPHSISGAIIKAGSPLCVFVQGSSWNASVPECRGPIFAQGFVQKEPCQQTGLVSALEHDFDK